MNKLTSKCNDCPSRRPSKPYGEWVRKYDDKVNCYWYECDQCGSKPPKDTWGHEWHSNFCPNCGAKMKGADNEID